MVYGEIYSNTYNYKLEQILYNDLQITQLSNDTSFNTLKLDLLQNTDEISLLRTQHFYHIGTTTAIPIIVIISMIIIFLFKKIKTNKPRPTSPRRELTPINTWVEPNLQLTHFQG